MVSGEPVNVARKNKSAVMRDWKVPLMLDVNPYPDYEDKQGSIARRFGLFLFETGVLDRDTALERNYKITQTELVTVLLRCVVAYNEMVESSGDATSGTSYPLI